MPKTLAVLNVEDSKTDSDLVAHLLKKAGYELTFKRVDSAAKMRAALKKGPWDVVIADYSLPQFDGHAALALLQGSGLDLPFLAVSGTIGEDLAVEMMRAGARDYLMKDNLTRLVPAIERELEQAAVRRRERQAALEARRTEQRFRSLIENAPDGVVLIGPDGKFVYASPAARRMFGYPLEGPLEADPQALTHPDDLPSVQLVLGEVMQNPSRTPRYEYRFRHVDGSWIWIESTFSNHLADPAVGAIVINFRNITDRRLAEEKLRESEARHRLITAMMSDYIYSGRADADGGIRTEWASGAFERITGYTLEEINALPAGFGSLILPEDLDGIRGTKGRIFEQDTLSMEYRIRRRDGEIRWLEDTVQLVQGTGPDRPAQLIGAVQDVTERRRAEAELYESQEETSLAYEAAEFGAWREDMSTHIITLDERARRHFGLAQETIPSQELGDRVHPEDRPRLRERLQAMLDPKGGDRLEIEYRIIHPDRSVRWVAVHARVFFEDGPDGRRPVLAAGVSQDITRRKQAEEELRGAREFLQGVQNSLSAHIAILDQDGVILQVNSAWREFGTRNGLRSADACVGMNYLEVCDGATGADAEEAPRVAQAIRGILEGRLASASLEYPCHGPDEKRWFLLQITAFEEQGRKRVVLAHESITERKRVEEALRRSEQDYRLLFDNANDVILIFDPQSEIIQEANAAACATYGFEHDELVGMSLKKLTKDVTRGEAQIREMLARGAYRDYESIHFDRQGKEIHFLINASVIEYRGRPAVLSLNRDITERIQTLDALRRSEEQYRLLFDSMTSGFALHEIILDGQGNACDYRFLEVNPAFERMTGLMAEQVIGRRVLEVIPSIEAEWIEVYGRVAQSGESERFENYSEALGRSYEVIAYRPVRNQFATIISDVTERRRIEQALHESELHYRALFEDSPVPVWEEDFSAVQRYLDDLAGRGITDMAAHFASHPDELAECAGLIRIVNLNKAAVKMYGAANREALIQSSMQALSRGELEHLPQDFAAIAAGQPGNAWEGGDETMEGQPIEISLSWSVVPGHESDYSRVIVITQDITERRAAEEQLRASEERFTQLANHIEEAFWMTDVEHDREVYLSRAAEEIWGLPVEHLMQTPDAFLEMVLPQDRPAVSQVLDRQRQGERTEMEYRIRRPDGSIRWVWDRAFPIFDGSGRVKMLAGIAADVTERKAAETALRKSEVRFAGVVNSAMDAIVSVDEDQRIVMFNPAAERMFGCPASEAMGQPLDRFIPERFRGGHRARIREFGRTGATARSMGDLGAVQGVRADGAEFPVEASISHIEAGGQHLYTVILRDVTERKQAETSTRRHLAELEALYETGLAVGRLLEPREIGHRVIESFARYLSWHHVAIRLIRPGTDEMELIAFNQPDLREEERVRIEDHFNRMIGRVGQGLSGWAAKTGEAIRTGNVHSHPQYLATHEGILSGLYMPLKVGDRVTGCISVESEQAYAFSAEDERLLATLANQAAVAFENARLFQAAQVELAERRRMEAALRAGEAHYRDLANSITDILFELDQDLRFTHWNRASETLAGVPASRAIGSTIREVFGESLEGTDVEKIFLRVLLSREPATFGMSLVVNRERRDFEVSAYPSMQGVSVVAKDVTDRKRAEVITQKRFQLMEFAARHDLETTAGRIADEISELTGSQAAFFHFVEEDQTTLGAQAWSARTREASALYRKGGRHEAVAQAGVWAEAIRRREPVIHNDYPALEDRKELPEGHIDIRREMVVPILRDDRVVAAIGVGNKPVDYTPQDLELAVRFADYAWDVTERKRMEAALAEERNQLVKRVEERTADLSQANANLARALRVKDEFLANMSHELRTPLNAILGLSESLGEQVAGPLNEKQARYVTTISESGHHLLALINDILDLAKIEAGQITLDIGKVDLGSICQASLRMIKQLSQKKRQQVSLDLEEGLGLVWADERRLKQMIVNLLSNAVKFTPEEGRLGLEVRRDPAESTLCFTVWDTGIGISEENLGRLFRPFVQVDSGLARETAGTGLGLALVSQMARLHGGRVEVDSRVGEGSRFTIVLPWTPAVRSDAASKLRETGRLKNPAPGDGSRRTVLVVEDTPDVIMMISDYLESAGYRVVTARDGLQGVELAKQSPPDAILMDIMMPHMDGFEATRALRADPAFGSTPIIGMTALAMPSDRERCLEAGMNDYISKPVNLKALLKLLQKALSAGGKEAPR